MMGFSRESRSKAVIAIITSLALLSASIGPASAQGQPSPSFSRAKLEQLAAPIALYPDALLTQILMAATYPLDVVQAARWRKANPGLTGSRLEQAVQSRTWDESIKGLTAFPVVLRMMDERLDWTEQLGEAFLAQQQELLAAVQDLRRRAEVAGYLKSSQQQRVTHSGSGPSSYVIIEPVDPEFVYVPEYDPVVYGQWPYPDYPAYRWYSSRRSEGRVFWFAAAAVIGTALWARWDWNRRQVAIDPVRFNRFNRSNRDVSTWQHDPSRRRGAPYKVPALVSKFRDLKALPPQRGVVRQQPVGPVVPSGRRQPDTGPAPAGTAVAPKVVAPGKSAPAVTRSRIPPPAGRSTSPASRPTSSPPVVTPRKQPPSETRRAAPHAIARPLPEVRRSAPISRPAPAVSRPAPAAPRAVAPPRAPAPAVSRPAPAAPRAVAPPRAASPAAAPASPAKPVPQSKPQPR